MLELVDLLSNIHQEIDLILGETSQEEHLEIKVAPVKFRLFTKFFSDKDPKPTIITPSGPVQLTHFMKTNEIFIDFTDSSFSSTIRVR